jgi:hypothetical protein
MEVSMTGIKLELMVNSVVPPVIMDEPVGGFRSKLFVGLRFKGTIEADDESIKAIRTALDQGYHLEMWGMKELKK